MLIKMLLVAAAVGMQDSALVQEVVCAETGFSRAAEVRDREAFLGFIDPDARFLAGGVARGHDEIIAAWDPFLTPGGPSIRWRPATVEVSSDGLLAISRGPYRTTGTDTEGNRQETWGHFTSTWRRRDGGDWLVVFDAGGDAGMTPTDAERQVLEGEPDCP
jgi:ketosteroid isomerase-like protein